MNKTEATFTIEKDFSINNIEQIKKQVVELLEKNNNLNIELKNIENFDLTSIQLLYSLKKSKNKKITIKAKIKEDLVNIIKNAGFEDLIN